MVRKGCWWLSVVAVALMSWGAQARADAAQQDESEWLGASTPASSVAVRAGGDSEQQTLLGADGVFTLPNVGQLSAEYTRSEVDSGDLNSPDLNNPDLNNNLYWSLAYSTDPLATWSAGVSYRYTSSDNSLDTDDWQLWGRYFPGAWSLMAEFSQGQVTADNPFAGGLRNRPATLTYDRQGLSLSYTYFGQALSLDVSARVYDYENDFPSQLGSSRLGLYIAQQSLSGLYDLIDYSLALTLGYQNQHWGSQLSLSQFRYALTEIDDQSLSIAGHYYLTESLSISGLLAQGLEDNIQYGETALRWHW